MILCAASMKEGLEGVVEFLLPELAFAGEQGMSIIVSASHPRDAGLDECLSSRFTDKL